jgi:hypothetical protein
MNQAVRKRSTTIGNFEERKKAADPDVVSQQIRRNGLKTARNLWSALNVCKMGNDLGLLIVLEDSVDGLVDQ